MATTEIIVSGSTVAEVVPQINAVAVDELGWLTAGLPRSYNTDSGQKITPEISLTFSSVWQATSLISAGVAGLPMEVYRRDPATDDREQFRLHPAWSLLNLSPRDAPEISANAFRETLQAHALIRGNGYAEIIRNGAGRPVSMVVLPPDSTWADDTGSELSYWTTETYREDARQIPARNVFHLRGLSSDGVQGYSVFQMAKNSWGLGLAQEKHGNRHFRNGSRPNIALRTPAPLTEDQATSLRQRFEDRHRGLDQDTSTAVLSGGLEIVPFSISNEDSQWLQSREFQKTEVASWFNLPPHFLGASGTTGYASLVEENRRYLQQTLLPWLRKWQAEADLKLLTPKERSQRLYYWEHNLQSLLEADTAAVVDQISQLIQAEIITPNEARKRLNLNRRDDGFGDRWRNPAINPATNEEPDVQPEAAVDPAPYQNLLADRLQHLQDSEFKQISAAARRRNVAFARWAKKHFDGLRDRITQAVEPIAAVWASVGVQVHAAAVAEYYIDEHRERVVGLFHDVPRNVLEARLVDLYDTHFSVWPARVAAIAWRDSDGIPNQ